MAVSLLFVRIACPGAYVGAIIAEFKDDSSKWTAHFVAAGNETVPNEAKTKCRSGLRRRCDVRFARARQ
jgi:hypothetical protein